MSISLGMTLCKRNSESPVSLLVVLDDLVAVLIRLRPLNDRSAEQLVTGSVHNVAN